MLPQSAEAHSIVNMTNRPANGERPHFSKELHHPQMEEIALLHDLMFSQMND